MHPIVTIVSLTLVRCRVVVILKELRAIGEVDFLKPPHRVVGISEVVARNAAYVHARQSSVVIVRGIIDVHGVQPGEDLLLLSEVTGGVVVALNIGNDARVPAVDPVFGFGKPASGVISEVAPVNDVIVPVAPPVCVFEVADVVIKPLRLVVYRGAARQVSGVIVRPILR